MDREYYIMMMGDWNGIIGQNDLKNLGNYGIGERKKTG